MAVSTHRMRSGKPFTTPFAAAQASPADPHLATYVGAIDDLIDVGSDDLPRRVAQEVSKLVANHGWLPETCCEPGDECYRRHLLYADPAGRYTVLAVVWRPGQTTPVHGHTAWGAVGVYQGNPSVDVYTYEEGGAPVLKGKFCCCPGQVSHVTEGVDAPHRIFNDSDDIAITIHTYGRDLTEDPASINILL